MKYLDLIDLKCVHSKKYTDKKHTTVIGIHFVTILNQESISVSTAQAGQAWGIDRQKPPPLL